MRKGATVYFAGSVVSQASALLRYVILARLLGAEQLGLAAMLILTAQFFDSISDTGSDRFIIQDADGDSPRVQGVVQVVLAARGVLIAVALLLLAAPLSGLYREADLRPSLIALGLAPLIAGFVHLDLRRLQRVADFRAEGAATIVSETLSLIVTVAAAIMVRDHTAVIYGLVARAASLVVMSHVLAKRPYRWALGRAEGVRFSVFAFPLFLNGLLLFFGSQGDRLIVGSGLGAEALGHYSAVLLLAFYPTSMLARFVSGIHLPQLARARASPVEFGIESERLGSRTLVLTLGIVAGFTLVAPFATPLLYGAKFAEPLQIFALLAVVQAARFMRFWPTNLAVSIGRSAIVMQNNIARMVAIPVALAANFQFHSLEAIVSGFIVGELVALATALWLLKREGVVDLKRELGRVGLFCLGGLSAVSAAWALQQGAIPVATAAVGVGLVVGLALLVTERATFAEVRQVIVRRIGGPG